MQFYIGIIVQEQITNKQRYAQALNEIENLIQAHKDEVQLKNTDYILKINCISDFLEISLPKDCDYFSTSYFRMFQKDKTDHLRKFISIGWECLMILKENFPSKVDLYEENLQLYMQYDELLCQQEIQRRQLNNIQLRLKSQHQISKDEIDDILCIQKNCLQDYDFKGIQLCSLILTSQICSNLTLQKLNKLQSQQIENISNMNQPKNLNRIQQNNFQEAIKTTNLLYSKIINTQQYNFNTQQQNINTQQYNQNDIEVQNKPEVQKNQKQFEQPKNLKSYIFVLKETMDIERATFILNHLNELDIDVIQNLNKNKLFESVQNCMQRYCEGAFGIDQSYLTKFCIFHNKLFKYILICLDNNNINISSQDFFIKIGMLFEEGAMNIIQNLLNQDQQEMNEKDIFYEQTLALFQIFAQKQMINSKIQQNCMNVINLIDDYFNENEMQQYDQNLFYFYQSLKEIAQFNFEKD